MTGFLQQPARRCSPRPLLSLAGFFCNTIPMKRKFFTFAVIWSLLGTAVYIVGLWWISTLYLTKEFAIVISLLVLILLKLQDARYNQPDELLFRINVLVQFAELHRAIAPAYHNKIATDVEEMKLVAAQIFLAP